MPFTDILCRASVINMFIVRGLSDEHVNCVGASVMYMLIVRGLSDVHVHCAGPHGCTC